MCPNLGRLAAGRPIATVAGNFLRPPTDLPLSIPIASGPGAEVVPFLITPQTVRARPGRLTVTPGTRARVPGVTVAVVSG
eukprot:3648725-Rhodomonas_salina.1